MLSRTIRIFTALLVFGMVSCTESPAPETPPPAPRYSVINKSIVSLQKDLTEGLTNSVEITQSYIDRIHALDSKGPRFNAIISLNPDALKIAAERDAERANGKVIGPLHGIPLLIKDNIETQDNMPTTAGSLALQNHVAIKDSTVVKKLREAGAIILGKTNLSEWANFRSEHASSGWSAIKGFTQYPFDLTRNPCGSSSGSAVAVALSFAPAAIGTETDGSITCPAGMNSLVGLKPTVGLVSRAGIIPIAMSQDTAGPMTQTVEDTVLLLSVIAGTDELDRATKDADIFRASYHTSLRANALELTKIGVMRNTGVKNLEALALFEKALRSLEQSGATLVELEPIDAIDKMHEAEFTVLLSEFKDGINAFLSSTNPENVATRNLDDLIRFNAAHSEETPYFGQDIFLKAAAAPTLDSDIYKTARVTAKKLAGPEGIDKLLRKHRLDALVAITNGPSWKTDPINGDHYTGGFASLAAVAGYPHITVPMGQVEGLPIGLSIVGSAWSEAPLLAIAFAFEQTSLARVTPELTDNHSNDANHNHIPPSIKNE